MKIDVEKASPGTTSHAIGLASVIIPNYNHAQYISDAIRSVLNQSYRNFEIIVVDDGSTDNSRQVVARFGDQVRYIWQENQGLSAARNTGIRAAQGNYLGVLDADDMYEPDFLSTLVSLLDINPEAAAVYCGYRFVDQFNNPLPQIEARQIPTEQTFEALVDGNFLVPESMFVRRCCYEDVGLFDESLRALEDWDMWLRITRRHQVVGTTRVLTRHRVLTGSMSTDPDRMLTNRLAVVNRHFGPAPSSDVDPTALERRAYGRAYLSSSVEYLQYGDKDRAYECIQNMAEVCPDMLAQLDTFYQLGLGNQPKGSLDHFASLDVPGNAQTLVDALDRLFSDAKVRPELSGYRRPAYTNAYFVAALLSYGARQFQDARRFLLSALAADPRIGFNRRFATTFVKAHLPASSVDWTKHMRHRIG